MPRLSKSQQQFVTGVAARTGLSPRVVAAWVVAEEGYRKTPVGHADHNWLNIGNTDTKWYGGGDSWSDPNRAARLTAKWIKGTYSVPGFGRAAPGIRRIVRTAGQSPDKQIQAIANSGWASSGYEGGSTLRNLYHQIQGVGDRPPVTQVASKGAQAGGMATTRVDDSGRRQAIAQALLGSKSVDPMQLAVVAAQNPAVTTTSTTGGQPARVRARPKQAADTSGAGTTNFEGHQVAAWIAPALVYARRHGWTGQVNSGYRSYAEQKRIYDSGVRPAAVPGTSNHEGAKYPRGAVDVSGAEQLSRILARSPWASKLKWAGSKDPVHFSHPHNGSY